MNSENSKTSEPHRFRLDLTDKYNLKDPKKNIALANLSIHHTWKTSSQNTTTINLKLLLQFGMVLLICLIVLILLQTFKITLNLSSKNTKLWLKSPNLSKWTQKQKCFQNKYRLQIRTANSWKNKIATNHKKRRLQR